MLDAVGSADLVEAMEVATWQARPLEAAYPLIFFDAPRVKIPDEGLVRNKPVHIALGVRADGTKESWGFGSSRTRVPNSGCVS
jgi:putative transposase